MQAAIALTAVAVIWALMIRMHVRDRMHGRVPGTEQTKEYADWAATERWNWRDILWPKN